MQAWVRAARFEKAKTLKGGLVARSVDGLPFLLEEGLQVAFVPPQIDAPRSGRVLSLSECGDTSAVVLFDSVSDLETAERLVGCYCLVRRQDLPEDALLLSGVGLQGFSVFDDSLGFVGTVSAVEEMPGQNLLKVDRSASGAAAEVLIPLVDEFILGFDEQKRRLDVNLPSGLLDL